LGRITDEWVTLLETLGGLCKLGKELVVYAGMYKNPRSGGAHLPIVEAMFASVNATHSHH